MERESGGKSPTAATVAKKQEAAAAAMEKKNEAEAAAIKRRLDDDAEEATRAATAKAKAKEAGAYTRSPHLILSAFYGIGGARRICVARVKGV